MSTPHPKDPEQYIRDLERGTGQTPGAAPEPSGTDLGSPFGARGGRPVLGGAAWPLFRDFAKVTNTPRRRLVLGFGVASAVAIVLFLGHYAGKDTVHGDLIMINSGTKGTIDCNDGNLKLDGDSNTYTVTGHCRRLEVFGGANHVTVDSADTISTFGDDNVIIYHSGSPTINKTGNNNIVSQRLSTR